ncbi:hypothetical protein [Microlunatus sp. GCM10028923]|uniref:hypothetical protein n=1 Tax=Microlunatus sp. GCM10028923 TaxID=3273400 RepID=UPI003616CC2F
MPEATHTASPASPSQSPSPSKSPSPTQPKPSTESSTTPKPRESEPPRSKEPKDPKQTDRSTKIPQEPEEEEKPEPRPSTPTAEPSERERSVPERELTKAEKGTDPSAGTSYCDVLKRMDALRKETESLTEKQKQRAFQYRLTQSVSLYRKLSGYSTGKEKDMWTKLADKFQELVDYYVSSGQQLNTPDGLVLMAEAYAASDEVLRTVRKKVDSECKLKLGPGLSDGEEK